MAVTYEATPKHLSFRGRGMGRRKGRKQASQKAPERRGREKVRNHPTVWKPEAPKQVGSKRHVCDLQTERSEGSHFLPLCSISAVQQFCLLLLKLVHRLRFLLTGQIIFG